MVHIPSCRVADRRDQSSLRRPFAIFKQRPKALTPFPLSLHFNWNWYAARIQLLAWIDTSDIISNPSRAPAIITIPPCPVSIAPTGKLNFKKISFHFFLSFCLALCLSLFSFSFSPSLNWINRHWTLSIRTFTTGLSITRFTSASVRNTNRRGRRRRRGREKNPQRFKYVQGTERINDTIHQTWEEDDDDDDEKVEEEAAAATTLGINGLVNTNTAQQDTVTRPLSNPFFYSFPYPVGRQKIKEIHTHTHTHSFTSYRIDETPGFNSASHSAGAPVPNLINWAPGSWFHSNDT